MKRTIIALCSLGLVWGCGDEADWDKEILVQLFKAKALDVGTVTVRALQDGKTVQTRVNSDGAFFKSCSDNIVRIIPAQKSGAYSPVTITASSDKTKATVSATANVGGASTKIQLVLGAAASYDPPDCKPGNTPQQKATGDACKSATDCKGDRCLVKVGDGSTTHVFSNGYCSTTCFNKPGACAGNELCFKVKNGFGKVVDAMCMKTCKALSDCRSNEGYFCTPGGLCFPK